MDKENLAAVRQSFANAALGHKIQEVAASRKAKGANFFKKAEIGVVGVILALLVIQSQIPDNPIFSYLGAGLTVVEILMLVMRQMYHFDEDIVSHKNAAAAYMALRDKYKSLIADIIKATLAVPEITKQRDGLLSEYQLISKLSLPTDDKDYPEALTRLKLREDDQNIWSDAQIDHLLPVELRRK
ncbi:SLATT domain-containing protein [Candidatus Saccharibacteria bacterium]|nr:SLATT domain-containing protein [Candidatus Saccharibacteria bacterium]MBH1972514.1 SLATT domain-containing protein [Candidatus Saccharibacteria bacterium]MBH1990716.1 SLATT domain-containing protein [Candidatus Saccharibacteria bacterium]